MTDTGLKHLRELALRAAHTGRTQYSRFLEPSDARSAVRLAGEMRVKVVLYGGWPQAERCVAAFYTAEDPPSDADFPVQAIRIDWNARFACPHHRDLLGAVMGLGIERDATGDIALGEYRGLPCACLMAVREMAPYIAQALQSAGRASVRCCLTDEIPRILPPEGETLRVTVQNLRLDAVSAAGYHLSRSEAQRLVSAGLVKLNHVPELRPDVRVEAGDLISVRGYGRLKIEEEEGQSRRGRQVLRLFKYGK